jgi:hypothetical protein
LSKPPDWLGIPDELDFDEELKRAEPEPLTAALLREAAEYIDHAAQSERASDYATVAEWSAAYGAGVALAARLRALADRLAGGGA